MGAGSCDRKHFTRGESYLQSGRPRSLINKRDFNIKHRLLVISDITWKECYSRSSGSLTGPRGVLCHRRYVHNCKLIYMPNLIDLLDRRVRRLKRCRTNGTDVSVREALDACLPDELQSDNNTSIQYSEVYFFGPRPESAFAAITMASQSADLTLFDVPGRKWRCMPEMSRWVYFFQ